ncbi:unnamed protein product [Protopolystoma xenopodis]|uniref:Saposin B-type domain-containing protein n=1 Tax=Protopolystoma xenopodis TaxID=117903 RepID=A0A448WVP5_9PLAT|nr:unnamed protein product [Protopolystoma xenopodis]
MVRLESAPSRRPLRLAFVVICWLLLAGQPQQAGSDSDHSLPPLPKEQFSECITACGEQMKRCVAGIPELLNNYYGNRRKVQRILFDCCVDKEHDQTSPATTSFARCAKLNCRALVWG